MDIQIGQKGTSYTFTPGTRTITVLNFPWTFDSSMIKFISVVTGINNANKGFIIAQPLLYAGQNSIKPSFNAPSSAAVAGSITNGGSVTPGTHDWVYTWVYDTGDESLPSPASNTATTLSPNFTVPITVTNGGSRVVAKNIYRRIAGLTGLYLYAGQISDNTGITFTDTIADASLGVSAPSVTGVYDINYSTSLPVLDSNDLIFIRVEIPDDTRDEDLNVIKNINLDSSELPPADPEIAIATDTNLAAGVYYYELSQGPWRNCLAQLKATCSNTISSFRIYKTLDPSATVPVTNGSISVDWSDHTKTIYNTNQILVPTSGTLVLPIENWAIDDNMMPCMYDRFLLQYTVLSATNFFQLNMRKF